MKMKEDLVGFTITFDQLRYFSEAELNVPNTTLWEKISSAPDLDGAIEILTDSGLVRITDVIAPWIQNMCYGSIPNLVKGIPELIIYAALPGSLKLTPLNDNIHLEGDYIVDSSIPKKLFLPALIACGDRFVKFITLVKRNDPEYLAQLSDFPALRNKALTAMKSEGNNNYYSY
jgi:hypothetical protein